MIERYEDECMALIWNDQARLDRWFQVEVAQMHRIKGPDAAHNLQVVGAPDLARVAEFEQTTRHEVFAFLRALDERIRHRAKTPDNQKALRQWLHYGLTSSDVTDTAQTMAIKDSHRYLERLTLELVDSLSSLVSQGEEEPSVIGRTHGQLAAPMPAGHRWKVLEGMLIRAINSLRHRVHVIQAGKLSGPVGTSPLEGEVETLERLGLAENPISTQLIPRDMLARWAHTLVGVARVCEAIATQVWLLAQSGIGEVTERRTPAQVGSSAMPHKSNPIGAENIRGLVRLVRMYADALQDGIVQWGEHDLAHSAVERVALPDLCHTMAAVLKRTGALVDGLEFVPAIVRMSPPEYVDTHAELLSWQESGVPYVEAHERLRQSYLHGKIDGTGETAAQRAGLIEDERFSE